MMTMDAVTIDCPGIRQQILAGGIDVDALHFGVIGFDHQGLVQVYNRYESEAAGLAPGTVLGQPLFTAVAPCMNNFMVAERFNSEPALDQTLGYVLTFRMRPTRVTLRLLQSPDSPLRYILIKRA